MEKCMRSRILQIEKDGARLFPRQDCLYYQSQLTGWPKMALSRIGSTRYLAWEHHLGSQFRTPHSEADKGDPICVRYILKKTLFDYSTFDSWCILQLRTALKYFTMNISILESLWYNISSIPTKEAVHASLILGVCWWLVILILKKWASSTAKASRSDLERPAAGGRGKVTRSPGGKEMVN